MIFFSQTHGGGEVHQGGGGDHGGLAPHLRPALQLGRVPALSRLLQKPQWAGQGAGLGPVSGVWLASVQRGVLHEARPPGPRVQAVLRGRGQA